MQERDSWSHDIVLGALVESVRTQRNAARYFDFVLLTGDLAYSGKAAEYTLVSSFVRELAEAAAVPIERVFCVPGNHDIDRSRQKLCFAGARATLQDPTHVDELLAGGEDLTTLLLREEAYRSLVANLIPKQPREYTAQSLAYVSRVHIDEIDIAIMGLDSSWLAQGGLDDHGKLLMGERQVIDAINIARGARPPHLLIAISHHPLHLLQEFDRLPIQHRIEQGCHFYHNGHLHEPDVRSVGDTGATCMMIAAGAAFETRQSKNVYSIVTVNLAEASRSVGIFQFQSKQGRFFGLPIEAYPITLAPTQQCGLRELADTIGTTLPVCAPSAHYLAALILGTKADFPNARPRGFEFCSIDLIRKEPSSELQEATLRFSTFRNVLGLLYGRMDLPTLVSRHGAALVRFGDLLARLASEDESLRARLIDYERGAAALSVDVTSKKSTYTQQLLLDLAQSEDWASLRPQAERHLDSPIRDISVLARRLLALSLSHSSDSEDLAKARSLLKSLLSSTDRSISDACVLATLLFNDDQMAEARLVILDALRDFQPSTESLLEIGQRLVEATGDKVLREALRVANRPGEQS
jgi:predicted MPP superfamily phosphohydrolase